MGERVGGRVVKWAEGRRRATSGTGCEVCFLRKGVVGDFREGLHGFGSGGGTGRDGGSVQTGENGYQAWAIMSPYGSEGTY